MIKTSLLQHLSTRLLTESLISAPIRAQFSVSGGSVNRTYALISETEERLFVKLNDKNAFPGMFEKEQQGLLLLKEHSTIHIPQPLLIGSFEEDAYLIMEFIEKQGPQEGFWESFGEGVATLHQNHSNSFGLSYNNYNGSLIQVNEPHESWADFFIRNRLMVQEKLARDAGLITTELSQALSQLYKKLDSVFPEEAPSLLHGDLWSGNFMCDDSGNPVIMDPAVYFGHREMDIAMSLLFGGFHKKFYQAYQEHYPLVQGWEERIDICNLYPLMVHVNLFGPSYASRVASILKKFR